MKRLLLLTLGLTMIGAAKAQEEKLEIKHRIEKGQKFVKVMAGFLAL